MSARILRTTSEAAALSAFLAGLYSLTLLGTGWV